MPPRRARRQPRSNRSPRLTQGPVEDETDEELEAASDLEAEITPGLDAVNTPITISNVKARVKRVKVTVEEASNLLDSAMPVAEHPQNASFNISRRLRMLAANTDDQPRASTDTANNEVTVMLFSNGKSFAQRYNTSVAVTRQPANSRFAADLSRAVSAEYIIDDLRSFINGLSTEQVEAAAPAPDIATRADSPRPY